jgi:hypothetical protein
MIRKLLVSVALVLSVTAVMPASPASADELSCTQAVQKPYQYLGLMWFGTMVICNKPIEAAYFSGTAETSGGVPVAAAAGPAQLGPGPWPVPTSQYLFFWSNPGPCPLTGDYHTTIHQAVLVATDGSMMTLIPASSGDQRVTCLL